MKLDELDFEQLPHRKPYPGDMVFKIDGMSEDEYIAKITEEINAIDLTSVPIDKWDIWVTFLLATLEVGGDFFLGDPDFKYSLANRNGRFVKELNKIHDNDNDRKRVKKKCTGNKIGDAGENAVRSTWGRHRGYLEV